MLYNSEFLHFLKTEIKQFCTLRQSLVRNIESKLCCLIVYEGDLNSDHHQL